MFSYVAYGLGIRSSLPLPELVAGQATTDVIVRLGRVDCLPAEAVSTGSCFRATADKAYLWWDEVGVFLVREGREIVVDPVPGVEERLLRLFLLGPALAVLLHQREWLVLHASAVTVDGGAVAFLGGSGWGKSTLAAALHIRGHGVVTDDVAAIRVGMDCPIVIPGFPQLKLWPEAAVSLGDDPETLPQLHPKLQKRARHVSRGFPQTPLPLKRIYVLAKGPVPEIEPLGPQEALVELVRHSYCTRLLQTGGNASHFLQCVGLVNNVAVCRLRMHQSLAALPELARIVEEHFIDEV